MESEGEVERPGERFREYADERDVEAFWAECRPRSEPIGQRWFLPTIVVLIALSVPWYWPRGSIGAIVLGLPAWVWMALLCSAGISAVTAYVALRHWRDEEFEAHQGPRRGPGGRRV